jgi:hypothetical protein
LKKDGDKQQYTPHLAFENRPNTAHNITFHFSEMFMCAVQQITYSCPVVPIHSNEDRPKKQKLLAQISYPNQFATAIVTSTGALIAALQVREVEKASQGCPFNRI